MTNLDSILKSRDITLPTGFVSQSCGFSSSHIWMWELDHKEGWMPKNWCFWIMVWEKTCESPLDCKEVQPINPKGNEPWIFFGKTDAEAKAPILWPPDVKSCVLCAKLLQSCLTLCDPVNYSPQGSSVHRILQARILEWVAVSFSRKSSRLRD